MLLNDLMKQFNESIGDTGPKFTGYWKGKDAAPPGKKMVGSESINNEEANPTDVISVDVPLFLRLMEYAKEDAKTDMDLHDVTERAVEAMKQGEHLYMEHYQTLVGGQATGGEQPTNEAKKMKAKDDPCWKGYKMVGKKMKNGREVPNCVPGKKGD